MTGARLHFVSVVLGYVKQEHLATSIMSGKVGYDSQIGSKEKGLRNPLRVQGKNQQEEVVQPSFMVKWALALTSGLRKRAERTLSECGLKANQQDDQPWEIKCQQYTATQCRQYPAKGEEVRTAWPCDQKCQNPKALKESSVCIPQGVFSPSAWSI